MTKENRLRFGGRFAFFAFVSLSSALAAAYYALEHRDRLVAALYVVGSLAYALNAKAAYDIRMLGLEKE